MRGIVFTGGEGPTEAECRRLAEAADLVVAADSGFLAARKAGISPGWIVGDMDSLGDPALLDGYPPERVIRYPHEKDFTDTELALKLLWEQGCDETWLLGGGGGRTDHLLAIRSLFEREPSPDRWITGAEDIRRLRGGGRLVFPETERVGEAITGISVFPLGNGPWKAESRGLKWPLDRLVWSRGFFGISNEAPSGSFSISAVRGDFLVLMPLIESRFLHYY
jgi:thiamine pyrophosphokinase